MNATSNALIYIFQVSCEHHVYISFLTNFFKKKKDFFFKTFFTFFPANNLLVVYQWNVVFDLSVCFIWLSKSAYQDNLPGGGGRGERTNISHKFYVWSVKLPQMWNHFCFLNSAIMFLLLLQRGFFPCGNAKRSINSSTTLWIYDNNFFVILFSLTHSIEKINEIFFSPIGWVIPRIVFNFFLPTEDLRKILCFLILCNSEL